MTETGTSKTAEELLGCQSTGSATQMRSRLEREDPEWFKVRIDSTRT